MDPYSDLLKNVLSNVTLRDAIDRMAEEYPSTVNLIAEDWEERLDRHETYRRFQKEAGHQFLPSVRAAGLYTFQELKKEAAFSVLVASECRLMYPYDGKRDIAIGTLNARPLEKIAAAMFSDMGAAAAIPLSHEFKFKFETCSNIGCPGCRSALEKYRESSVRVISMRQPCIFYTSVFDGREFSNFFLSTIGDCFPRVFHAVLQIKLTSRYDYVDQESKQAYYRIGGEVQEIIAFKPNVFKLSAKTFRLGHLMSLGEGAGSNDEEQPDAKKKPIKDGEEGRESEDVWRGETRGEEDDAIDPPVPVKRRRLGSPFEMMEEGETLLP